MTRLLATAALLVLAALPARADPVADCNQTEALERRIAGCTALIEAGELSGQPLSLAHRKRGQAFLRRGQTSRALADVNESIALDPGDADLYFSRGTIYAALRQPMRAIRDYDAALRLNPNHAHAFYNRGQARCTLRQGAAAAVDYAEGAARNRILAYDLQAFLSESGTYSGPVNGLFTAELRMALTFWTREACTG